MAKGYVRALAEQINQQGTLKLPKSDDDESDQDEIQEMSKSSSSERSEEMARSTASVSSSKSDETLTCSNLVKTLIQAVEQHKCGGSPQTIIRQRPAVVVKRSTRTKSATEDPSSLCPSSEVFSSNSSCDSDPCFGTEVLSKSPQPPAKVRTISTPCHTSPTTLSETSVAAHDSSSHPPKKSSSFRQKPFIDYKKKPKLSTKKPTHKSPSSSVLTLSTAPQSQSSLTSNSPKKSSATSPNISSSPSSPVKSNKQSSTSKVSPLSKSGTSDHKAVKPHLQPVSPSPSFVTFPPDTIPSPPKSPKPSLLTPVTRPSVGSISDLPPSQKSPTSRNPSVSSNQNVFGSSSPQPSSDNVTSESQPDPVRQWLSNSHHSTTSNELNQEVGLRGSNSRHSSGDQYRNSVFQTIYDNSASLSAAELFDSSWSDSDPGADDDSEGDSDQPGRTGFYDLEHMHTQVSEEAECRLSERRHKIAQELLQTERDYVSRLHLLHHVFYESLDKENRQNNFLPADALNHMFSNIKSIYLFHNDFLLPQLEQRMEHWDSNSCIGDLMKKNAPFLKMYTEYIRNFDNAMKLINHWMEKSTKFSEIIINIQKLPESKSLSLQHHMLGPIQRIPRYELLLKDYVKHLPEDSPNYMVAKDALDLVTRAATHSNEAMKKIETFHKLLDIYQSLRGVPVDFISPTREFVAQGPVTKIAARSGEKQLRHIFLFNDLVLVCILNNLLGTYSVRSLLDMEGMEIKPGTCKNFPNSFLVHSKQKAVELLDESTGAELPNWQEKIEAAITNYKKRKQSLKTDESKQVTPDIDMTDSLIGKSAPVWIQDDAATMCMLCTQSFNVVRRRHHCRACGKLICRTCCRKAPLEYNQGKIDRVCLICYDIIVNKQNVSTSSPDGKTGLKKKGILHVNASSGLISSYMNVSEDNGQSWPKLWVTGTKNFALFLFKAHEDVSAIFSLPLPGHTVENLPDWPGRQHVLGLSHKEKRVLMLQAENATHLKQWISYLSQLALAKLPEENWRLSSQSTHSNSSSISDSGTVSNEAGSKRDSVLSGSQADSGYPGDSNNSLANLAAGEEEVDHGGLVSGEAS